MGASVQVSAGFRFEGAFDEPLFREGLRIALRRLARAHGAEMVEADIEVPLLYESFETDEDELRAESGLLRPFPPLPSGEELAESLRRVLNTTNQSSRHYVRVREKAQDVLDRCKPKEGT